MRTSEYDRVCYMTEQREERVHLRNLKSGETGYSIGCTDAGATVQVKLDNGELDSWVKDECVEIDGTLH